MAYTRRNTRTSRGSSDRGRSSGGDKRDVKYDVLAQEIVEWEPNNFVEVSHKAWAAGAKSGGGGGGGKTEGEFYSITRGYYATGTGDVEEGTPIYTKSITIPTEDEVVDNLLTALDKVVSG